MLLRCYSSRKVCEHVIPLLHAALEKKCVPLFTFRPRSLGERALRRAVPAAGGSRLGGGRHNNKRRIMLTSWGRLKYAGN